jgi:hypothetical protein
MGLSLGTIRPNCGSALFSMLPPAAAMTGRCCSTALRNSGGVMFEKLYWFDAIAAGISC